MTLLIVAKPWQRLSAMMAIKSGFLTEVSDQCNQIGETIKEDGQKYGFEVIKVESYNPTDLDLRTNLAKIKASKTGSDRGLQF